MALSQQEYDILAQEVDKLLHQATTGGLGFLVEEWAVVTFPKNPQGDRNYSSFLTDAEPIADQLLNDTHSYSTEAAYMTSVDVVAGKWLEAYIHSNPEFVNSVTDADYNYAKSFTDKAISFTQGSRRGTRGGYGGYASNYNQGYAQRATRQAPQHTTYGRTQPTHSNRAPVRAPAQQTATNHGTQIKHKHADALQQQPQQPVQQRHANIAPKPPEVNTMPAQPIFTTVADEMTVSGVSSYPGHKKFKKYFLSRAASYRYPYFNQLSVPKEFNPATHYLILGLLDNDMVDYELIEKSKMNEEAARYAVRIKAGSRSDEIRIRTRGNVHRVNGVEVEPELIYTQIGKLLLQEWMKEGKIEQGTTFDGLSEPLKEEYLLETAKRNAAEFDKSIAAMRKTAIENNDIDRIDKDITIVDGRDHVYLDRAISSHISTYLTRIAPYLNREKSNIGRGYNSKATIMELFTACRTEEERQVLLDTLTAMTSGTKANLDTLHRVLQSKEIPLPIYEKINRFITKVFKDYLYAYLPDLKIAEEVRDFMEDYIELTEYFSMIINKGKVKQETILNLVTATQQAIANLVIPTYEEVSQLYPTLTKEEQLRITKTAILTKEKVKIFYLPDTAEELQLDKGVHHYPVDNFTILNKLFDVKTPPDVAQYIYTADGQLYKLLVRQFDKIVLVDMALN